MSTAMVGKHPNQGGVNGSIHGAAQVRPRSSEYVTDMRTPPVTPTASPAHSRSPAPHATTAWMSRQWLPHGWLGALQLRPPLLEKRTAGRLQFCGHAMSWTTTASSPRGLTETVGSLPAPTSDSWTDAVGRTDGVGVGASVAIGVVGEGTGVEVAGGGVDGPPVVAVEPGEPAVTVGEVGAGEPQAATATKATRTTVAAPPVRTGNSSSGRTTWYARRTRRPPEAKVLAAPPSRPAGGRRTASHMTFDPVGDRVGRRTLPPGRTLPMCVTCPAQVVGIDAQGATVDTEGRRRRASTVIVPDVTVGDWVLVGMGTILERLDPDVAREMRDAVRGAAAVRDA